MNFKNNFLKRLRNSIKTYFKRKKFRKRYFNHIKSGCVGKHTYIASNSNFNKKFVSIGKYCSIARETHLGLGNHPAHLLSSHPFVYCSSDYVPFFVDIKTPADKIIHVETFKKVTIGNDVWIGQRAIIMDGVTVGDGAIVGAGAIVTKDVPPYAIVVGAPAKVVKYRFSAQIIEQLLELKWWDYPEDFLTNKLPFDDIEECIKILKENINLRN